MKYAEMAMFTMINVTMVILIQGMVAVVSVKLKMIMNVSIYTTSIRVLALSNNLT